MATAYMPTPAIIPIADARQMLTAVVKPRTVDGVPDRPRSKVVQGVRLMTRFYPCNLWDLQI